MVVARQGPCLGGALEFSLSCDFRLATPTTHYALPEIDIDALPGSGGISRLARIAGPHWTRSLVMSGEQALNIGIVHAIYEQEEFVARTGSFAAGWPNAPTSCSGWPSCRSNWQPT